MRARFYLLAFLFIASVSANQEDEESYVGDFEVLDEEEGGDFEPSLKEEQEEEEELLTLNLPPSFSLRDEERRKVVIRRKSNDGKRVKKIKKKRRQKGSVVEKKKRRKGVRKVCPRCVDAPRKCKGGRVSRSSRCEGGFCCSVGEKATKRRVVKKKKAAVKTCSTLPPCEEVNGVCQSKKIECNPGYQSYRNSKHTKYCSKNKCVCCGEEDSSGGDCETKSKCSKKKGYCTNDPSSCEGQYKQSKGLCTGLHCVCCFPPKPCKTRRHCKKLDGVCGNLKTLKCKTKPLEGREYCGGKECGCCVEKDDPGTPSDPDSITTEPPSMEWTYHGEKGPNHWGNIFVECNGNRQSPINLPMNDLVIKTISDPFVFHNYDVPPDSIDLVNNGHTIVILYNMEVPPSVRGGGLNGTYDFRQLHFHWGETPDQGSEHLMDSLSYPFEIHLVHFKREYGLYGALDHPDGLAVLGSIGKFGNVVNPLLEQIAKASREIIQPDASVKFPPVELFKFLPHDLTRFVRYFGSLTTPPCSEKVIWTVFTTTLNTTMESLQPLHLLMGADNHGLSGNYRPPQTQTSQHSPIYVIT